MRRFALIILLPIFLSSTTQAQVIYWQNPSFEGEPKDATVPIGWLPCEEGTTPDILPGYWGIYQEAAEGDTFVGLITRQDGTWESITQRLSATIPSGDCYTFNLDLAKGSTYSGYNLPLKLRVWGSTSRCTKDQLLFESQLINHTDWRKNLIEFTAEQPIRYIILEAFHSESRFSYQGNILLDNLSPLQKCPRA